MPNLDPKNLTIACINSLFDGVSVEGRSFKNWFWLHIHTFIGIQKTVKNAQRESAGTHAVKQVIESHNPDIIVINEVIKAPWGSETLKLLKENGYSHQSAGYALNKQNAMKRITILASKYTSDECSVPVYNFPGGRFCALQFNDIDLMVIGAQGSPFYSVIRKYQLRAVFKFAAEEIKKGTRVIIAGDFNSEVEDRNEYNIPESMQHLTEHTFPHPEFLSTINKLPSFKRRFIKSGMQLKKGQRSLDHIFIPEKAKVERFEKIQTQSDHLALVATIDISDD